MSETGVKTDVRGLIRNKSRVSSHTSEFPPSRSRFNYRIFKVGRLGLASCNRAVTAKVEHKHQSQATKSDYFKKFIPLNPKICFIKDLTLAGGVIKYDNDITHSEHNLAQPWSLSFIHLTLRNYAGDTARYRACNQKLERPELK